MKPIDLVPIVLGILCYVLAALLTKLNPSAAMGLFAVAGTLTGIGLPQLSAALSRRGSGGFVRLPALGLLAGVALGFMALGPAPACHNVKPDQFLNAVVDCAKVNPQASAAFAQVETCLASAVSGSPGACLSGLVTELHFTVDEVACVTAWIAQQENAKVAAGTAGDEDLKARRAAVDWLKQEGIQISNSYPAK